MQAGNAATRWLKAGATAIGLTGLAGLAACAGPSPTPNVAPVMAPVMEPLREASQRLVTNSVGMKLVWIPAGTFLMGSDESPDALAKDFPGLEQTRFSQLQDEGSAHEVAITRAFYLGQHEVTVGQFRRFVEASGYVPQSVADGTGGYGYNPDYVSRRLPHQDAFEGRDTRYSWRNPGFAQTDNDPVVNVSWNDAQAMARWLSRTEGRTYRLPTEAEWEYACRAGTQTRYHSGNRPESLTGVANVFDASARPHWPAWENHALNSTDGFAFTAPVGQFAPNAFGLHDMHGNVWEWTSDWHDEGYYAQSPRQNPTGPQDGSVHVRRGGSWHTWPFYARCSYRNWNSASTRYTLVGFRLVMETPQAIAPPIR